jgi:hypothetical protein
MVCTYAETVIADSKAVLEDWILLITAFRDLSFSITVSTAKPGIILVSITGLGAI